MDRVSSPGTIKLIINQSENAALPKSGLSPSIVLAGAGHAYYVTSLELE